MDIAPSDPSKQFVARMNRDTYYSTSVFDITGDINLTTPETDKYISIQLVGKNHETQPMIHGPGRHKLTAKTKYALSAVRILDDQARKKFQSKSQQLRSI